MSSLVTTASPWENDDSLPKKRQSTMRRTIKLRPEQNEDVGETTLEAEKYGKMTPGTIDDQQNYNAARNQRVNELLSQITSSDAQGDNQKMGDFKPMSPPSLNVKRDADSIEARQYMPPAPSYLQATVERAQGPVGPTGAKGYSAKDYSNYQNSYGSPLTQVKPYYANMGIGATATAGGAGLGNDKLMEKINYMIHLLEENQSERTNNITEEFILYTFLGIFVIFIVDSFSRSGKYVR
jgi:hypothetical protein